MCGALMLVEFTKNDKDRELYRKAFFLLTLTNNIFVLRCSVCFPVIILHLFSKLDASLRSQMLIISHKQLLQCFLVHFCRHFIKLDGFTSSNLKYCRYPLNLNHPNFNIAPYGQNQKNELLEMTKRNGTKLLPLNSFF